MIFGRLARRRLAKRAARPGSILLLVLVVVAALALGTGTYLQLMQTELRAVRYHGRTAQAKRLSESAVEYLKALLALPPAELQLKGGLSANPQLLQALLADDQPSEFDRGRFTVLAPTQVDGRYSGVRFGLEDESAKLNLNVLLAPGVEDQARNRLLALPGMTPLLADAILDWIDPDDQPREFGAERDAYAQLDPPYEPRNGPIASLDELLLIRGVTPELLYGLDQNRNLFVDAGESPRGVLTQLDNTEGLLNRGWSAYLTLKSVEAMGGAAGGPIDVNSPQLQQLYNALKASLGDGQAKFIIAYRQYGPATAGQNGGNNSGGQGGNRGGGGGGQGGANAPSQAESQTTVEAATPSTPDTPTGPSTPANVQSRSGSAMRAGGQSISPESIQLDFQKQGGTQINSLLDLIGAQVQIPAPGQGQAQGQGQGQRQRPQQSGAPGQNTQPQTVDSPWQDSPAAYQDLLKLYDAVVAAQAERVAGRVNINAASRPVLRSIPGMTPAALNQIVAVREPEPDRLLSQQRHAIWPLVLGFVTLDEMRQLERFITTRGDAFSGQAVGFFDAGRTAARGEFIVDRSSTSPRLRYWRDLTPFGPGFSPQLLGAQPTPTP